MKPGEIAGLFLYHAALSRQRKSVAPARAITIVYRLSA
jgi:hypothetical protein